MCSIRKFGAVSLVLLAGLAVGCDKKVQITFTNQTVQVRNVQLTTPYGVIGLGTIGPGHGNIRADVKIRKDDLPAQLVWQAGELSGTFVITKKTPGRYHVNIVQTVQLVPAPAPGQTTPGQPVPAEPPPGPAQPAQPAPGPVQPAPAQPAPAVPAQPAPPTTGPAPAEPEPMGPLNPN